MERRKGEAKSLKTVRVKPLLRYSGSWRGLGNEY